MKELYIPVHTVQDCNDRRLITRIKSSFISLHNSNLMTNIHAIGYCGTTPNVKFSHTKRFLLRHVLLLKLQEITTFILQLTWKLQVRPKRRYLFIILQAKLLPEPHFFHIRSK